jgi:hypothetical protein
LRIERRAWPALRLPLTSIEKAEHLETIGGGTLRLFGVGGFFGSYGLFSNRELGRFRLYSTQRGKALLVRRHDALPLVITPDDLKGSLEALDPARAPQTSDAAT